MADWNDLKNAFERDAKKTEEEAVSKEQKLLKSITVYLSSQKGVSPIQGYDHDEIAEFLDKSVSEIKACLGGEWENVSDEELNLLIYTLSKKVKKYGSIIS